MPSDSLQYGGNVCISGLTASGKTTHSHLLTGEFGLTYVSGSQIQLNLLGLSPIQAKDFWITKRASELWDAEKFERIDSELLKIESANTGCIFDTSTMPWRHKRAALCIWLESSIESRSLKSIVSHHGNSQFSPEEYPHKINSKDKSTIDLYKGLYNIDIGTDLTPFHLILDISNLIHTPTLDAALVSIETAHDVIRSAVAWYLTKRGDFKSQFEAAVCRAPEGLVVRNVLSSLVAT
jgi:cytidylate kinase